MVPAEEVGDHYRAVVVGTEDRSTFSAASTSHDYTENEGPFMFHPLEVY